MLTVALVGAVAQVQYERVYDDAKRACRQDVTTMCGKLAERGRRVGWWESASEREVEKGQSQYSATSGAVAHIYFKTRGTILTISQSVL